ncbi:MAG: nucleotidyltransferase, partial [Hydrogenimonas sp.]
MYQSKQDYLQEVLETYRMRHVEDQLEKFRKKRDEVKEAIEKYYRDKIYNPINSGSFAKHTAINSKFDLDIVVPFKRNSFDTLEEMFNHLYNFLTKEYGFYNVRKQTVSIGVEFPSDNVKLDIVPGREQREGQYRYDNDLNLFINYQYGTLQKPTYIKTNIQKQIEYIKAKENERKIIRLLKIWKSKHNKKYKSFLLELLVIKAFKEENIEGNLWEKLKSVLEYIQNNVVKDNFTLKDPGNSGNNVILTL